MRGQTLLDKAPPAMVERWERILALMVSGGLALEMVPLRGDLTYAKRKCSARGLYLEAMLEKQEREVWLMVRLGCEASLRLYACPIIWGLDLGERWQIELGWPPEGNTFPRNGAKPIPAEFAAFRERLKGSEGPISEEKAFEFIRLFVEEFLRLRGLFSR
jgi:hypothetical protein